MKREVICHAICGLVDWTDRFHHRPVVGRPLCWLWTKAHSNRLYVWADQYHGPYLCFDCDLPADEGDHSECPINFEYEVDDEEPSDQPSAFFLQHNRMTDTVWFGPFSTVREAGDWAWDNGVQCNIKPLFLTVDWNR